jgi:uncharacterized cupin superfamily protein
VSEPGTRRPAGILRAAEMRAQETEFAHPWNPNSAARTVDLATVAGLARTGVNLVRVAPGKESGLYHAHQCEEEWAYVISGRGLALVDGVEHEVGAGDFLAFPTPSVPHHMRNPFADELVYLSGGERCDFEIVDFPALGRRMVRRDDERTVYERGEGKPFRY